MTLTQYVNSTMPELMAKPAAWKSGNGPHVNLATEVTAADQALDVLHVGTEVGASFATPGLLMGGASVAAGVVSIAAFAASGKALKCEGAIGKVDFVGKASLGVEAALACGAMATYGSPIGSVLGSMTRPFGILHGAADVVLGLAEMKKANDEHHPVRWAKGICEFGMGAGIIAANLAPTFTIPLQLTVLGFLAGKELAIHWQNLRGK